MPDRDIRTLFDSDSESDDDHHPESVASGPVNVDETTVIPQSAQVSGVDPTMLDDPSIKRTLFCSRPFELPMETIFSCDVPPSWGQFFIADGHLVRVPSVLSERSLEMVETVGEAIDGCKELLLWVCVPDYKYSKCVGLIDVSN